MNANAFRSFNRKELAIVIVIATLRSGACCEVASHAYLSDMSVNFVIQDESMQPLHTSGHRAAGNKRWFVAFLLLAGGFINYLDRASLAVAAPSMMNDLHLTNTDIGLLGSVFSLFFAFSQFPAGWLADRFGPRKVYASAASLWGFSTMITGLCSSLPALLCARALLGMTEAPGWPTSAKITSIWFPRKERALASSIWDASSRWGLAFAPPILVFMSLHFGWGALFYLAGSLGVIFGLLFYMIYRHPENHPRITEEERHYIVAGGGGSLPQQAVGERVKWRELFRYQSMWGMMLGWFCYIWLFNIFVTFLPLYLMKTQNMTLASMGIYASIPYFAGVIGAILGGYAVKWLIDSRRATDPLKAKKIVIMLAALISGATTIALPFCDSLVMALAMMTLAMFFLPSPVPVGPYRVMWHLMTLLAQCVVFRILVDRKSVV